MNKSNSSLLRPRVLTNILFLTIAITCIFLYYPDDENKKLVADWKSYTSVMGSVAATMVGFLVAIGALLYTISNTPLVSFLRKYGVEKRILFDLFGATLFWLICLFFSLYSIFPMAKIQPSTSGIISFGFSIAGLLSFLPIAYSLWMILSNIDAKPVNKNTIPETKNEDFWQKPTDLD
ncbi:hypothetical protein [Comamonas jiangduensis]|uniref:hypothetical protein n=1 Tax=Comamonas jiangduensis TaxID=1194168 RepID=UPI0024E0CC6C|nr:hypothetical protein [Comamonas jiangduensis]